MLFEGYKQQTCWFCGALLATPSYSPKSQNGAEHTRTSDAPRCEPTWPSGFVVRLIMTHSTGACSDAARSALSVRRQLCPGNYQRLAVPWKDALQPQLPPHRRRARGLPCLDAVSETHPEDRSRRAGRDCSSRSCGVGRWGRRSRSQTAGSEALSVGSLSRSPALASRRGLVVACASRGSCTTHASLTVFLSAHRR